MGQIDEAGLAPRQRAAVADALAREPALAAELELIDSQLAPGARSRFWRAFAAELGDGARPAAAVLPALERAASPGGAAAFGAGGEGSEGGVSRSGPGELRRRSERRSESR